MVYHAMLLLPKFFGKDRPGVRQGRAGQGRAGQGRAGVYKLNWNPKKSDTFISIVSNIIMILKWYKYVSLALEFVIYSDSEMSVSCPDPDT